MSVQITNMSLSKNNLHQLHELNKNSPWKSSLFLIPTERIFVHNWNLGESGVLNFKWCLKPCKFSGNVRRPVKPPERGLEPYGKYVSQGNSSKFIAISWKSAVMSVEIEDKLRNNHLSPKVTRRSSNAFKRTWKRIADWKDNKTQGQSS